MRPEALESRRVLMTAVVLSSGYDAATGVIYAPPYTRDLTVGFGATGSFSYNTLFSAEVQWGDGPFEPIGTSYIVRDGFVSGFTSTHHVDGPGSYPVSARIHNNLGETAGVSCTIVVVAQDTLVFTEQPTAGTAGNYMGEFVVHAEYAAGKVDDGYGYIYNGDGYGGPLTFSLVDAGGATLSGGENRRVRDGVASVYLMIDRPGVYRIRVSGPDAIDGLSEPIVVQGTTTLSFVAEPPATGPTGKLPAVKVKAARNDSGQPEVGAPISLTLHSTNGATLAGTRTATTDAQGLATFDDLTITKPGEGYTLVASSNVAPSITGRAFALEGSTLSFQAQPPTSAPAGRLDPVKVRLVKRDGTPEEGIAVSLQLRGGSGGTLSGTTTATTNAQGIATFTDLSINKRGQGYTLVATAETAKDATSQPFDLTSEPLVWTGGGDGLTWSDADNWEQHVAPADGDRLIFPAGSAPRDTRNDIAGLSVSTIDLVGAGYNLGGSPITLTGGLTASTGSNIYDLATTITGTVTVDVHAAILQITSSMVGDGALTVSGEAGGKLMLEQGNDLTGSTTVRGGTVEIGDTLDHPIVVDGGIVVLKAGLAGSGTIDVRSGVLFSDQALPGFSGEITVEAASTGGQAGDRAQLVAEADNALGTGTIIVAPGAGNYPVIQASGSGMFEVGRISLANELTFRPGARLGVLGAVRLAGAVALGGEATLMPQPGASVTIAGDLGSEGGAAAAAAMSVASPTFPAQLLVARSPTSATAGTFRLSGRLQADTQLVLQAGEAFLDGALDAAADVADQVVVDGATVELTTGLKGNGGIDVRKGVLYSQTAVTNYGGGITVEALSTGSQPGDRAQLVVEADDALGTGTLTVAAGSGNYPVIQASGNVMTELGRLTLGNDLILNDGARLGAIGSIRLVGQVALDGAATLMPQPGASIRIAGELGHGGNGGAVPGYVAHLTVALSPSATAAGALRLSGDLRADTQLVLQAGEAYLGGALEAAEGNTDQVVVDGAIVELVAGLSGTGGIDIRKGVVTSETTQASYDGDITVEALSTGSKPGDRAQLVAEADDALGSGAIIVAAGSGNYAVLQASGDAMTELGRLTLGNDLMFQPGSRLGALGNVRIAGAVVLEGVADLMPLPGASVELAGVLGAGDDATAATAATETPPSSTFLGRLTVTTAPQAAGTGSVRVSGDVAAAVQLVFEAGESDLAGALAAADGVIDQVVVDGATLYLDSGLAGAGGIDLRKGIVDSDRLLSGYSGEITLEAVATGSKPGDRAQLVVEPGGTLGTGVITVAPGPGNSAVLQGNGEALDNDLMLEHGTTLGVLGTVWLERTLGLDGEAIVRVQPGATLKLTGAIQAPDSGATGFAGHLIVAAATAGGTDAGSVVVAGAVAGNVQLEFKAGESHLGGELAEARVASQVIVQGGKLYLDAGLTGAGGIDLRTGVVFSDHALPGYSGDITLQSTATGSKPGDRAQLVAEADDALGSGAIIVAAGSGNYAVLQASGDAMTELGRLTLGNNLMFQPGSRLGTLGHLRLTGAVGLEGVADLMPLPGAYVNLAGTIGGGDAAAAAAMAMTTATATSPSGGYLGQLTVTAAPGLSTAGAVAVSGGMDADVQLVFEAGEDELGGVLAADGLIDQAIVAGATVRLVDDLAGNGGLTVRGGTLISEHALPAYHGMVTLVEGRIKLYADGALGTGPILKEGGTIVELIGATPGVDPVVPNPLTVTAGTLTLRGLLSFPNTIMVAAPGTLRVDGGATVVVCQGPLTGDGSLALADGALTIERADNPYTGSFERTGGTLTLLGANALRSTTIVVASDHVGGAVYGEAIRLTASLGAADARNGTPTGVVQFTIDGVDRGAPVALTNGTATLVVRPGGGTHLVTARYLSDVARFADSMPREAWAQVVAPAPLVVTVEDATRPRGQANPAFTARYAGFVAGEGPGVLQGTLAFTTDATPASAPGTYAITASGVSSPDYVLTFVAGTLTVGPGTNPSDPATAYVTALYRTVLGREPDPAGLDVWTAALRRGASRASVAQRFWRSDERLGRCVDTLYATYLHRAADPAAQSRWVGVLKGGLGETSVAIRLLNSAEYRTGHPTPAAFVRGVYRDVLGRAPTASEEAAGLALVRNPAMRPAMALRVLTSREEATQQVEQVYRDELGRAPGDRERAWWVSALTRRSLSPTRMAELICRSAEFEARSLQGP